MALAHSGTQNEGTPPTYVLLAVLPILRRVVPMLYYLTYVAAFSTVVFAAAFLLVIWQVGINALAPSVQQNPLLMVPIYLLSIAIGIALLVSGWSVWAQYKKAREEWLQFWVVLSELDTFAGIEEDFTTMLQEEQQRKER